MRLLRRLRFFHSRRHYDRRAVLVARRCSSGDRGGVAGRRQGDGAIFRIFAEVVEVPVLCGRVLPQLSQLRRLASVLHSYLLPVLGGVLRRTRIL